MGWTLHDSWECVKQSRVASGQFSMQPTIVSRQCHMDTVSFVVKWRKKPRWMLRLRWSLKWSWKCMMSKWGPTYPQVIQNSYGKWPFIVVFPLTVTFHSYVKLPEGIWCDAAKAECRPPGMRSDIASCQPGRFETSNSLVDWLPVIPWSQAVSSLELLCTPVATSDNYIVTFYHSTTL